MRTILFLFVVSLFTGCATVTTDLAKTLRYSSGASVGVENIEFTELAKRKRGEACTLNLLHFLPLYGDGSLISAAQDGEVNNVELIGETGLWYFPFNYNCTVVYGKSDA